MNANIRIFVAGIVGIGMATALLLPERQTVPAINAVSGLVRGSLATAMGTGKVV